MRRWIITECSHPDPFVTNIELLPTDKASMLRKQQKAQDILSPHLRILQFFESHFNAIRLGSPHSQRIFCRVISSTLVGLKETYGHPLAREVHFHIILFGLRVLKHSTTQSAISKWKLKDQILSAALSWFRHPPRLATLQQLLNIVINAKLLLGGLLAATDCKLRPKTKYLMTLHLL